MANLKDSPKFAVYDDYYTPKSAWIKIQHLIPKDKIIYEAFTLNAWLSKSPEYLTELGFNVIHDKTANFLDDKQRLTDYDIIVSNPPFQTKLKQEILKKLVVVDKPFIIIMNSMNTFTKYIRDIFKDNMKHLQVITPSGKINFDKLEKSLEDKDGYTSIISTLVSTKNCSFYCIYLCYKMELTAEQLWL